MTLTIFLKNGCKKGKCNWKGHISVLQDKPLNLCNLEYHGNHDLDHIQKKPLQMSNSVRKTITKRVANTTPSMLASELINNSKILDTTINTLANQVQPTSTRFTPNLESIQNALKYDKKLHHPSISEFEKVRSIMDNYEAEGVVISKQYGTKNAQDPKEQAVLLGIAFTIMPALLTKYPDLLAVDSTGRRNSLNFPNTAFIVRSDEPRGRIVATFVGDKETIPVVDFMFESLIKYSLKNGVQLNLKWLAMDKWDPYLVAAKKYFPNTQVVLCDWHEDAKKLQAAARIANLAAAETIASYFRKYWFGDWVDTWPDYKHNGCPMKMNMLLESYFKKDMLLHYKGRYTKSLHTNLEKIGTSMRVDCEEIESTFNSHSESKQNKWPAAESAASSSLESYLHQKDANGHNKDELRLPEKRGPKNKRKNRLVPGESIQLRDVILNVPCYMAKIVEIISESKVIIDINFENGDKDQCIVQLDNIIGYADEQIKKKLKVNKMPSQLAPSYKDSHGNVVVYMMPYGGKKGTLYLTSTCPVDTSLTLVQSALTYQDIYNQANAFALANPNSCTNLLLQVFDLMKQKKWTEAKFLWVENLPIYTKLARTDQIDLFGGLSEQFFEQFFHDSLDQNFLVVKNAITSICDSDYCLKKVSRLTNSYEIILIKPQTSVLPESNYFEACLKNWQKPCIVPCGAEFKAMDEESTNIPKNSVKIDKYTSVETRNVKLSKVKSTRQIDQRLLLILVINVTGISIIDEETNLENKDIPEEISFPLEDVNIKQRYRLMGDSFCDNKHHITNVHFENVKNTG
ncbi:hypothetical protein F8M41_018831 [Gigaspora margarita]|uniref:MULE transposase domain-containing protein n=1 Tax=Gigaspora margarita TaxID=4874 RepID=A0A8H4AL04_GIGMA|nr:hypothetical protein F8M41_018831 [Gigaspora margarita]